VERQFRYISKSGSTYIRSIKNCFFCFFSLSGEDVVALQTFQQNIVQALFSLLLESMKSVDGDSEAARFGLLLLLFRIRDSHLVQTALCQVNIANLFNWPLLLQQSLRIQRIVMKIAGFIFVKFSRALSWGTLELKNTIAMTVLKDIAIVLCGKTTCAPPPAKLASSSEYVNASCAICNLNILTTMLLFCSLACQASSVIDSI
jgi:hypothetical protein